MKRHCAYKIKKAFPITRIAALALAFVLMGWVSLTRNTTPLTTLYVGSHAHASQPEVRELSDPAWPHEVSDLRPDPAITRGRLSNGFRYVLMNNQRPKDRVSLHLYIRAGSLNETEAQQGIAHFLEHMLFNGSTHFPPGELVRYFQSIGMQFGNDANARTGFDQTVYDIILPTGDKDNLNKGLLVMHDYAMGALLLEEEVRRESGVILAEMRSRDSAAYRTFKATLNFELPNHLISERLPIGKAAVIKEADRNLLKGFYDAWYRPDHMVLVMVGDFSIPLAEALIADQFRDFKPRAPAPRLLPKGTINHSGLKIFHHYEPETGGTTVSLEVVQAHEPESDSQALRRQQTIEDLADMIVQNRLDARLKTPGAPYTSATVGSGIYLNHIRYAEISADSSAENWQQTLSVMEQELRRAILYGFSEAELARVKKDKLKMLDNALREAPTRNSTMLARKIIRNLSKNRVFQSPEQEKNNLAGVVSAVTLDDVHQAFAKNWPADHRLVLVTGNADLKKSSPQTPEAMIRNAFLASAATVVRQPEAKAVAVFPYLPMPENTGTITSQKTWDDLGITRIRFSNGFTLNLKPTDYKNNEVLANLVFGHGRSAEPKRLPGITLLAEATVNESGLGSMNTNELERALAGKSTYVEFRIAETHFNFFAETISDEVELLFQLIYAHVVDPGFRPEALALARDRLRQEYQSNSRSIEGTMRIKGLKLLAGEDSRFGMPSLEMLQAIRLEDIEGLIVPSLNSAPMELSIVGDFDVNTIIVLAQQYLGSLPDGRREAALSRQDLPRLPVGTVNRIEVKTQIPKAMVVAAWQTDDFWDINRTRRLSVLADVFSERLRERIREKLGASYSPYAFNRASRAYDGYGIFQAYVSVAPHQTDTVLTEVNAIASDLAQGGVTDDELLRVVDPILTSIKELRQTNGYWLNNVMTGSYRHPQQLEWANNFLEDYAAVTVDELDALAATYLTDQRAAALIIEPEKKADKDA